MAATLVFCSPDTDNEYRYNICNISFITCIKDKA